MTTTHTLETAGANITYDVRGPLPAADGRPPLFMIAQPMDASGFDTLASHFPDRTVVTYDPRGLGRSIRRDGRVDHAPTVQADDVHAVIGALGDRHPTRPAFTRLDCHRLPPWRACCQAIAASSVAISDSFASWAP
jgi:pimeloyl-ACP methyl ester carboxylesterase